MWCLINHTKKHVVSAVMYDIGRQLQALMDFSEWLLQHHIEVDELTKGDGKYSNYTWDV